MNELLRKIYDTVIYYEEDAIEMGWVVDEEICKLIQPYQDQLSEEELDELKNLLYNISLYAQREGFMLGLKYALSILNTIHND